MSGNNVTFDVFRPKIGGELTWIDDDNDDQTPDVPPTPSYVYQDDSGALVYVWPDYEDDDYIAPDADTENPTYPEFWKVLNDCPARMRWDIPSLTTGVQIGNEFKFEKFSRALVDSDADIRVLDYLTDITFNSGGEQFRGESYWVRSITPVLGPSGELVGKELYAQYVLRGSEVNG